jgi:hypothetical protein
MVIAKPAMKFFHIKKKYICAIHSNFFVICASRVFFLLLLELMQKRI